MDSTVYRCGWCGCPTDKDGEPLNPQGDAFKRAVRIIEETNDATTIKVDGQCCPNGDES